MLEVIPQIQIIMKTEIGKKEGKNALTIYFFKKTSVLYLDLSQLLKIGLKNGRRLELYCLQQLFCPSQSAMPFY